MERKHIPLFALLLFVMAAAPATKCRLVEYPYMPAGEDFPPIEEGSSEGRVSLRNYLWFPNPLSSPEVIVVVRDTSDFQLQMKEENETPIDEFIFQGIEPGVYIFVLKEPRLPERFCTIRLILDDVPAGEVRSRTHCSSYKW